MMLQLGMSFCSSYSGTVSNGGSYLVKTMLLILWVMLLESDSPDLSDFGVCAPDLAPLRVTDLDVVGTGA